MQHDILIYSTDSHLILQFNSDKAALQRSSAFNVSAVSDLTQHGELSGIELFLYEEPRIMFSVIKDQFRQADNIDVSEEGLLYIYLRKQHLLPGRSGVGRLSTLNLQEDGTLLLVKIPWAETGATMPFVDYRIALNGLTYQIGEIV